jgi:hypothetical protein
MKRVLIGLFAATMFLAPTFVTPAVAEGMRGEAMQHPRIAKAIHELEDAIAYLEAAPHDFGGHKGAALEASHRAVEQLKLALAFRAEQDTRHGR